MNEIVAAEVWDIWMLNRILKECRVYARPNEVLPQIGLQYPREQEAVIHRVITLMSAGVRARTRARMELNHQTQWRLFMN
jgi:hypothetical protein